VHGVSLVRPMGFAPITTCPHCSKLIEGTCEICGPEDPHPSCEFCRAGRIRIPWYRNEVVMTVTITVVVAVSSGLIIQAFNRRFRND
jgi:hypothetical protein